MREKTKEALKKLMEIYPFECIMQVLCDDNEDGVMMGQIIYTLYGIDADCINYICTPDLQLIDSLKLAKLLVEIKEEAKK